MSLFAITPPNREPYAQSAARSFLQHANNQLAARVTEHRKRFHEFWDAPVPPSEIVAALGNSAAAYLAVASESVRHIATLAAIAGRELDHVLPPSDYMPRLPLTPNADGTVTVGTVEGLNAWGNPITPPMPEQP